MELLDQLWDETLAGPPPDSGLGKLRKHPSFSSPSASSKESNGKSFEEGTAAATSSEEAIRVSRRIMIVKPHGYSAPVSPAGSTAPSSPFSANIFKSEEDRSTSDVYDVYENTTCEM